MITLPKARNENIVVQNLEKEVLIYNLSNNRAFCLNETLAIIFNACDGKTSFDKLKDEHQFTDELIFFALDELSKENLIEETRHKFSDLSRREVIRRIGFASMVAPPVILSIVAPSAANAASTCANTGTLLFNGAVCGNNLPTVQCQVSCQNEGAIKCCSGRAELAGTCSNCTCQCAA